MERRGGRGQDGPQFGAGFWSRTLDGQYIDATMGTCASDQTGKLAQRLDLIADDAPHLGGRRLRLLGQREHVAL